VAHLRATGQAPYPLRVAHQGPDPFTCCWIHCCPHAVDKIEWQQPLQVLKYPDPRLRAVNARVGVFDDNLRELAKQMLQVMYE
jgi:hypothetical protein